MKYTEENLRWVLKQLAPTLYESMNSAKMYLPEILRTFELHMFPKIISGYVIPDECVSILCQAIDNLDNKGMFNFEE